MPLVRVSDDPEVDWCFIQLLKLHREVNSLSIRGDPLYAPVGHTDPQRIPVQFAEIWFGSSRPQPGYGIALAVFVIAGTGEEGNVKIVMTEIIDLRITQKQDPISRCLVKAGP